MKKLNLLLSFIFILIFQFNVSAQDDELDYYATFGIDPKAVEITDLRTETSRTFQNEDESFVTVIAPEVMAGNPEPIVPGYLTPRYDQHYNSYIFPSPWNHRMSAGFVVIDRNGINRSYILWKHQLNNNVTINSAYSIFNRYSGLTNNGIIDINPISSYFEVYPIPNNSFADDIYIDCGDGMTYNSITFTSTNGSATFNSNATFVTDMQSRLSSKWMAVGLKNTNESSSSNYLHFDSQSGYLVVNYTAPAGIAVHPAQIINVPGNGDTYEDIRVSNSGTGSPFGYTVSTSNTWIQLSTNSGTTTGYFDITVKPNFSGAARNGTITISSSGLTSYNLPVSQPNLASTLTLPDQEVPGQTSYTVSDWIVANSFLVGSGGNVGSLALTAGNKITLNPGFTARSDAGTFSAIINELLVDNFQVSEEGSEKTSSDILSVNKKGESSETDNTPEQLPTEFSLSQNYPNPFNPTTNIKFALPERSYVNLAVYNLIGQKVAELTNNELEAGYHTIQFNGSMLSSGLYFYRIITNKFSKTYKMLLVK